MMGRRKWPLDGVHWTTRQRWSWHSWHTFDGFLPQFFCFKPFFRDQHKKKMFETVQRVIWIFRRGGNRVNRYAEEICYRRRRFPLTEECVDWGETKSNEWKVQVKPHKSSRATPPFHAGHQSDDKAARHVQTPCQSARKKMSTIDAYQLGLMGKRLSLVQRL